MMEFEIIGSEAVLIRYSGTWPKVRIPSRYRGYPVSAIGTAAFEGAAVEEVEIPPTVRIIGERAFCDCRKLRFISGHEYANKAYQVSCFFEDIKICRLAFCGTALGDIMFMGGNVEIGARAFAYCEALSHVVFSSDCSCVTLCDGAFRSSGITSFFLPDHIRLEELPAEIFAHCEKLENVAFRAGHILRDAFLNCHSLRWIPLLEGLTALIYPVFSGCGVRKLMLPASLRMVDGCFLKGSAVQQIEVAQAHPHLCVGDGALLIDKRFGSVVVCAPGAEGALAIPKGVTGILPEAFADSQAYTVDLEPVNWIGKRAFYGSAIEAIRIPKLAHCGDGAFANCARLKLVEVADQPMDFDRWFHHSPIETVYYYGGKDAYLKHVAESPATGQAMLFLLDEAGGFFRYGTEKKDLMFDYLDHGCEITLTRIAGRFPNLTIPQMLEGKPVTGLGDGCIPAATEGVFLPDTIGNVAEGAFVHAVKLKQLSIPAGLCIDGSCLPGVCVIHHRE